MAFPQKSICSGGFTLKCSPEPIGLDNLIAAVGVYFSVCLWEQSVENILTCSENIVSD